MENSKREKVVLERRVSMGHPQSQDSLGFLCWLTALILAAEKLERLLSSRSGKISQYDSKKTVKRYESHQEK